MGNRHEPGGFWDRASGPTLEEQEKLRACNPTGGEPPTDQWVQDGKVWDDARIPPSSNEVTLLPCPFCGRSDTTRYGRSSEFHEDCDGDGGNDDYFAVFCDASEPRGLGGCGASSGFAKTCEEAAERWNRRPVVETQGKPARDAEHCDFPDCEQHWTYVLDMALAVMAKFHESFVPEDNPELTPCTTPKAFSEFVDEHARLMRIRASAPETPAPQLEWEVTYNVVAYNTSWGGYGDNASRDGFQSAEEAIAYAKPLGAHLGATVWKCTKAKSVTPPPAIKIWSAVKSNCEPPLRGSINKAPQ